RFVILHHKIDGGEHWDLMFEQGEVLLTWQLLREPVAPVPVAPVSNRCDSRVENPSHSRSHLPIPARRIGEHRKAYLDYEGPISGGRGHVHRVDAGTVEFEQLTANKCVMDLHGDRLRGRYSLVRPGDGDSDWVFDKADPPSAGGSSL
ncbi:MAG: DNA polymerase ligase N-terminal domain-containing protein, partial [Planctomycetota bacterium]